MVGKQNKDSLIYIHPLNCTKTTSKIENSTYIHPNCEKRIHYRRIFYGRQSNRHHPLPYCNKLELCVFLRSRFHTLHLLFVSCFCTIQHNLLEEVVVVVVPNRTEYLSLKQQKVKKFMCFFVCFKDRRQNPYR